ncbi:MAG: hypothetical protein COC24_017560 [Alphaproteobacteria bacterium]|nr:hypothetical protein [Alphaproteobacteria bacterium]
MPSEISLKSLDGIIQVAKGWVGHHLYQYNISLQAAKQPYLKATDAMELPK